MVDIRKGIVKYKLLKAMRALISLRGLLRGVAGRDLILRLTLYAHKLHYFLMAPRTATLALAKHNSCLVFLKN